MLWRKKTEITVPFTGRNVSEESTIQLKKNAKKSVRRVYAPRCAPPTCLPALLDVLVFAFAPPLGAIKADLLAGALLFFLSFLFLPVLNNDIADIFRWSINPVFADGFSVDRTGWRRYRKFWNSVLGGIADFRIAISDSRPLTADISCCK